MSSLPIIEKYYNFRLTTFKRRQELSKTKKIFLSLIIAIVIGLSAQISIPLPWTPIPITGQTFAVLLSGILLGNFWGALSIFFYIVLGATGIPWFAAGSSGLIYLSGPSGGYIIGFILASTLIGYFADKYPSTRKFTPMLILMCFANFIIIYGCGLLQLYIYFLNTGVNLNIEKLLSMGMLPFIIGDLIKIIIAALTTKIITPKEV